MEIQEIHRLPQRPVIKDGKKVIRPIIIIVKLANATTKHNIFGNLKRLKAYNGAKKVEGKPLLFVTVHLSQKFLDKKNVNVSFYSSKKKISRKYHGGLKMANMLSTSIKERFLYQEIILLKSDCPIDRLPDSLISVAMNRKSPVKFALLFIYLFFFIY